LLSYKENNQILEIDAHAYLRIGAQRDIKVAVGKNKNPAQAGFSVF